MAIYLGLFLLIFAIVTSMKVNFVAMENSILDSGPQFPIQIKFQRSTISRELDSQCGGYCERIAKPLLDYAHSAFAKEKSQAELHLKVGELIQSNADLQKIIESKSKELAANVELLESKDKQLAIQLELIETYKRTRDTTIIDKDNEILKFKSLILDFENRTAANDAKINELQSQQIEYLKMLEGSNCLGKSIVSGLKLPHIQPFLVPCNSKIAGSGWIVIQRRIDGSENFNRNWEDYKMGFGDLRHEYFMGLEKIHLITQSQQHELYIHLENVDDEVRYARYSNFLIGSEEESYKLIELGDYSGNAGDAFKHHIDMKFSTKDRDSDTSNSSCAISYESGWWFQQCYYCNLNGVYINEESIDWNTWKEKKIKSSHMMIRPKVF